MKTLIAILVSLYLLIGISKAVDIEHSVYEKCGKTLSSSDKAIIVFGWAPMIPTALVYALFAGPEDFHRYCD